MMIAFTVMLALAFGIGGSVLIVTSTANSLSQSRDAAASSHGLFLYTLSTFSVATQSDQDNREYEELINALTRLDAQGGNNRRSLRLSDSEGVVYVSRDRGSYVDDLIDSIGDDNYVMTTFRGSNGDYLLQIAGQFEYGSGVMYLESLFDINHVYTGRQYQQAVYRQLFITVVLLGAAISWFLSYLMTRPLRRLSRVTRTIASGDMSCRAEQGGKDEIGVLAADFNNMADRLEHNINELRDTMTRQEEFMGGLAHEMKTPMTSIIGYADLLRGHALSDDDKRDAANYIFMEGRRLEVLSLKLLDLIVLKKREFTFMPIRIESIVEDTVRLLQPVLQKRDISVSFDCDEGSWMIEPDLIMSLLLNLIDNARKAIEGAGKIMIKSRVVDEICEIRITDNGKGIPEDELNKIKDAFYRVDKSRSRAQGGVGLGLRLCDEIADLHDGGITFESEVGKGTTVIVKLGARSDDFERGGSRE
ncbi:MAG: HAMP domain-containing histidine kinase [Oscillospiraceae bacterium]|nr:HAMP domain-containing histidine kinase [Oscillospiraceae bacterium]